MTNLPYDFVKIEPNELTRASVLQGRMVSNKKKKLNLEKENFEEINSDEAYKCNFNNKWIFPN